MIRVVIVEDEAASRARIRSLAEAFTGIEVVAECSDGMSAVETIIEHRPDLVLLDIQLPELNGFEVVESLPHEVRPAILFITAFDEYAIRAFDTNAIDYVLKPFSAARFTRALGRAIDRLASGHAGQPDAHATAEQIVQREPLRRFVARVANRVYFIRPSDVDWIDVADNYLQLHVAGRTHLVRGSLTSVLPRLADHEFVRINRGLVVRVDAIAAIEAIAPATYQITMRDGARLSSSRTYADSVRALTRP
jgi:two-component system LytT family response regulator